MLIYCDLWLEEFKTKQQTGLLLPTLRYPYLPIFIVAFKRQVTLFFVNNLCLFQNTYIPSRSMGEICKCKQRFSTLRNSFFCKLQSTQTTKGFHFCLMFFSLAQIMQGDEGSISTNYIRGLGSSPALSIVMDRLSTSVPS